MRLLRGRVPRATGRGCRAGLHWTHPRKAPADAGRLCDLSSSTQRPGESMVTRFQDIPADILATPELQALLLQLPAGVIIAEAPSGRIVAANAGAERIWNGGLPKPESITDYSIHFSGYRPNGRPYGSEEWPLARALL